MLIAHPARPHRRRTRRQLRGRRRPCRTTAWWGAIAAVAVALGALLVMLAVPASGHGHRGRLRLLAAQDLPDAGRLIHAVGGFADQLSG